MKIADYALKVKQGIDVAFEYHGFKGSKHEKALVLYSGGMDSVSLAWNLLEHTEQDIHIHAIHLHNRENRINAEAAAIQNSVEYMQKKQRPFTFSSSTYSWLAEYAGGKDMTLALFQAARVMAGTGQSFNVVYTGDYNMTKEETAEAYGVFNAACINRRIKPIWATPLDYMTKISVDRSLGVYLSMPEELREAYWSCRRPSQSPAGFLKCGKCHACERQHAMFEKLNTLSEEEKQ